MLNRSKRIILFSVFALLLISPSTSFAWRDYGYYGNGYWVYHGSGRDYPYSDYVDDYYNPGYADIPMTQADYINDDLFIKKVATPPVISAPDQFIVNIPNKNGGFTPIVIKRSRNGFIGPQGEYYPEFPKVFQLEIMYGR